MCIRSFYRWQSRVRCTRERPMVCVCLGVCANTAIPLVVRVRAHEFGNSVLDSVIIFDYALFCTLTKDATKAFYLRFGVQKRAMFLLNFQRRCNDVALAPYRNARHRNASAHPRR